MAKKAPTIRVTPVLNQQEMRYHDSHVPATAQLPLLQLAPPPAGWTCAGIDPGKDTLNVALLRRESGGLIECLRAVDFIAIPWCTVWGWKVACQLFTGALWIPPDAPELQTLEGVMAKVSAHCGGFVLCEAQWADGSAVEKWSGLSALCQTSGALRAAAVSQGLEESTHWTRETNGQVCQRIPTVVGDIPWVYRKRGLAFVEPSAWRRVALSPRPIGPRAVVQKVEQRCAQEFFGRRVDADFSAAFGILLAALGVNYSHLGVTV